MYQPIAFILAVDAQITPFGDQARESLILDRPLGEHQREILAAAGFEVRVVSGIQDVKSEAGPFLVVHDNLFFSRRLLEEFLEKSRSPGSVLTQIHVRKGLFTRLLAVLQDVPEVAGNLVFPLWYVARGDFRPETAVGIEIDVDEDSYEGRFPAHMIGKEAYRFCVTSRPIMVIHHPLHLALANLAANFARLAEMKKMSWWQKLLTVARARSLNKFRILSAVSTIHPEAEIHPTAVVEGSIVEKGAKIGAYAVVRFSYVGEKAFIDDHAGLKFSIVGREAYIANNCVLFFSTVYPRAFLISGPFQFTLFGYDTAVMNAIPSDYRMDARTISVTTGKGIADTGLRFVGSVIGHRSRIAAGIIIAPGRMIPNDVTIFPDPGRVITKLPETLPPHQAYFLINGRLVPASRPVDERAKESQTP
jgi:carbonic anhydrase/acetyltransferase-like protein (isoleucine patch superfamily)